MKIRFPLLVAILLLTVLPGSSLRAVDPMHMESPQQIESRAAKVRKWATALKEMASQKDGEIAETMNELAESLNETGDQMLEMAQAMRNSDRGQTKSCQRSLSELYPKQEALRKRLFDLGVDLRRSVDANRPQFQSSSEPSAENRSKSPNRTVHSPDELRQWLDDTEPSLGK